MRVCFVTPVYPYPESGTYVGIERIASELTAALSDEVDVVIVTTLWNGGQRVDSHKGTPIHRLPDTSHYLGPVGRLLDAHYISFSYGLRRRSRLFNGSDIIHSLMPLATASSLRKRAPLVVNFHHGERVQTPSDLLYLPVHHLIERRTYRTADRVVVASSASQQEVAQSTGRHAAPIELIPHGVNGDVFQPAANSPGPPFKILFVGPLEPRKNVQAILHAVSQLQQETDLEVEFHIAGDGPEEDRLARLASDLGVNRETVFHGYCTDEELVPLYQSADAFVFPSFKEGFGMVMIEAMACGTPVIAPDEPPFDEVVGDAGILTGREPEALAEAMHTYASDDQLLERHRREAIRCVEERFTWRAVARQYVDLYDRLA